jgi:hypothetical protein
MPSSTATMVARAVANVREEMHATVKRCRTEPAADGRAHERGGGPLRVALCVRGATLNLLAPAASRALALCNAALTRSRLVISRLR